MSGERGQTQQDFAVGISVFLLTVLFVFAFLPTTLGSSGADLDRETYAADRLASSVFADVAGDGGANELNESRTREFFAVHDDTAALRANYSLSATTSANVTLETLDGIVHGVGTPTAPATAGEPYTVRRGATAVRVVRLAGDRYRLVVRVW